MKYIKYILIAALLALTGCATGPTLTPEQEKQALDPVVCNDKPSCDILWQRTQSWIAQNSHWRIQIATDVMLQTYGPGDDPYPAFTITKELGANGSAKIIMSARCGNLFGCTPSPIETLYNFQAKLRQ